MKGPRVMLVPFTMFSPSSILLTVPRRCFFAVHTYCNFIFICLCCAVLTAPCILAVISWEMAVLLVLLSVVFLSLSHMIFGVRRGT